MIKKLKEIDSPITKFTPILSYLLIVGGAIATLIAYATGADEAVYIFLGVLGAGIMLLIDYVLAGYFYFAAVDKGYKDIVYLIISFVVPPVGYLLVIALPDRGAVSVKNDIDIDELPEI